MTIYIPDDLAAEMNDRLADTNISAICQAALWAEVARVQARARITAEGFERIEVYDSKKDRDVAFQGREIGHSKSPEERAYLTPKHAIAVYAAAEKHLYVFPDFDELAMTVTPEDLVAQVARALSEKYVEELDI
jgi:hypothetical protein